MQRPHSALHPLLKGKIRLREVESTCGNENAGANNFASQETGAGCQQCISKTS